MVDIAIIGAGPAGLSAAINGVARNKSVLVLGQKRETSWIYKAEKVNNHLGMPEISGKAMIDKFYEHALSLNIQIKEGRALQILPMGDYFVINFDNELIEAKTLILAIGTEKKSGVKGEEELLGSGVSYCATCDGMLYRGKNVVVYGEIPEGYEDAKFLAGICKEVIYVYSSDSNSGDSISDISSANCSFNKKIKGKITEVLGEKQVTGVIVNNEKISCDGVFFVKETMPLTTLIPGLETKDGAIIVNRLMETNLKGVYAAGDCTGWPLQISKAIGEGLVAAQSCTKYLSL